MIRQENYRMSFTCKHGVVFSFSSMKTLPHSTVRSRCHMAQSAKLTGSTHDVLHVLPKVHKLNLDALFAQLFPLLTIITTILPLILFVYFNQSPHTSSQDSFSFADWTMTYSHNNEFRCSFDVRSLFTNVPLDETIQIRLDKSHALPNPPKLPRSVFKDGPIIVIAIG